MKRSIVAILAAVFLLTTAITVYAKLLSSDEVRTGNDEIEFHDARKQATQFIAYFNLIRLTPAQDEIKEAALSEITAPCCTDYSIATCCCPCNLAKSAWGLAHFLIVERGLQALEVREIVDEWLTFANDGNLANNACYKNQCNRPMKEAGCGGMDESRVL